MRELDLPMLNISSEKGRRDYRLDTGWGYFNNNTYRPWVGRQDDTHCFQHGDNSTGLLQRVGRIHSCVTVVYCTCIYHIEMMYSGQVIDLGSRSKSHHCTIGGNLLLLAQYLMGDVFWHQKQWSSYICHYSIVTDSTYNHVFSILLSVIYFIV